MHRKHPFLLALPLLLFALLPLGSAGTAHAAPAARYWWDCPPPEPAGDGKSVVIAVDAPTAPVTPGAWYEIGVRVTNTGTEPTTQPIRVRLHEAWGYRAGDPGFYEVPTGLAPGATHSRQVTVESYRGAPGNSVAHCDVSAFYGDDCATAVYEVGTGDPVNDLNLLLQLRPGKPGETASLALVPRDGGPSLPSPGPIWVLTAPAHTTWADPSASPSYNQCSIDDTRTKLTCPGSAVGVKLNIAPDAAPGTELEGGFIAVNSPSDPDGFPGMAFTAPVA